jgi:hypothetical protein
MVDWFTKHRACELETLLKVYGCLLGMIPSLNRSTYLSSSILWDRIRADFFHEMFDHLSGKNIGTEQPDVWNSKLCVVNKKHKYIATRIK